MTKKIIYYSFDAWTKGNTSELLNSDTLELYAESFEALIDKIKLFNKVACFECWTHLKFYKWEITLLNNERINTEIIDAYYFPEMIGAHKIKVWGKTYEI